MPKKAGQIVISISAGTAQLVRDLESGGGAVRKFGRNLEEIRSSSSHAVSGVQATSGALRVLEGGLNNNLRAAERFVANVLGLGPILQAAFPIIGALAFAGLLVKLGTEVYDFFEKVRTAADRANEAFRGVTTPLRLASDELAVANARLQNDIDRLQGKRENTLALALAEAKVAADKLADALDNDLEKITKVMKEQEIGLLSGFVSGRQSTRGDEREQEDFARKIAEINERGSEKVRAAADADLKVRDQKLTQTKSAQASWDREVAEALAHEIELQKQSLELAKALQRVHEGTGTPEDKSAYYRSTNPSVTDRISLQPKNFLDVIPPDQSIKIIEQTARLRNLNIASNLQNQRIANTQLTNQDNALKAEASNAKLELPFEDRMKLIRAEIDGVRAKLAAVGSGEAGEAIAKGMAEGLKAIEEVNKALEKRHTKLTEAQQAQIKAASVEKTSAEADLAWKTKLDDTTTSIESRITSLKGMAEAIGKGYEAVKKASVETKLFEFLGPKYAERAASNKPDDVKQMADLRKKYDAEIDAQNDNTTRKAVDGLNQQINLERALVVVREQGTEVVRRTELSFKLLQIVRDGARTESGALTEATKQQILAEIQLYNLRRANAGAIEVADIKQKIAGVQQVTAAVVEGAEAQRKAQLEAKYEQMRFSGSAPETIETTRKFDEAEHQKTIREEATRTGLAYKNQIELIDQQLASLRALPPVERERVDIQLQMRNLENERVHALVEEFNRVRNIRDEYFKLQAELSLQNGSARDGLRAFFLEMQEQIKNAGQIIEETLNSALDRVSDNLAKLMSGQKNAWAKMFQSIGEEALKSTIKSTIQAGLGKVGEAFGVGAGAKADGSSASRALWVRMASVGGVPVPGQPATAEARRKIARDIGDIGTGEIGDTVETGDTLAGIGSPPRGLRGLLARIGGVRQRNPITFGNGGILGTGETPTWDQRPGGGPTGGKPDGTSSNPVEVTLSPNATSPDGSAARPFYVVVSQGGFQSKPTIFEQSPVPPAGPNFLQTLGGAITGIVQGIQIAGKSIPGKASGGPVSKGMQYLVGERGPEIFIAPESGKIVDHQTTNQVWKQSTSKVMDGIKSSPEHAALTKMAMSPSSGGGAKLPARAEGGPVSKGMKYLVGERGPEIFVAPESGHIVDHETTKKLARREMGGDVSAGESYLVGERGPEAYLSGQMRQAINERGSNRSPGANIGTNIYYTIDARGTDPALTEKRVRESLIAVHGSAVSSSLQAANERSRRTPARPQGQ